MDPAPKAKIRSGKIVAPSVRPANLIAPFPVP
jgi:hypothetical protein